MDSYKRVAELKALRDAEERSTERSQTYIDDLTLSIDAIEKYLPPMPKPLMTIERKNDAFEKRDF